MYWWMGIYSMKFTINALKIEYTQNISMEDAYLIC